MDRFSLHKLIFPIADIGFADFGNNLVSKGGADVVLDNLADNYVAFALMRLSSR